MLLSEPRQAVLTVLLLLVVGTAACDVEVPSSTGLAPTPTDASGSQPAPSANPVERTAMPVGFPVLPGARPEAPPEDDPAAIARWTSDEAGPVAYAFYVEALPAAGYPTRGLFPGGEVAVIRFESPAGAPWQLVLTRVGDRTRIEVRLDLP